MKTRIRHPWFLLGHLIVLLGGLLLPVYRYLIELLPAHLSGCALHDYLFLYCPVCGGTRAVEAIFHLDFMGAIRWNAYVTLLILSGIVFDVIAWVRYARRKTPLLQIPSWGWIVLASSLIGYFILRNYLMIVHGIDPTGDLGAFWAAVMG